MKSWPSSYLPPLEESISSVAPPLQLLNTLRSQRDGLSEQRVSMYVCGITPYDATHLGHAATYLTFDLINRYLRLRGQSVQYIQNITDVDDPLLERATRDGVEWEKLASDQIALFRDDMTALRVLPPDHYMGAVETIPWVIEAISRLADYGAVYSIDNDLYFDITKDPHFSAYTELSEKEQITIFAERGGDPHRIGKRHPLDCLIWRSHRDGEPSWPSPFGRGRPGWHIECTAIALHYLAAPISIQGGGSDLHFPHHAMCAAEGRVLTGKDFAQRFVHTGMISLDGEKMSKSRGNLKFVSTKRAAGADMNTLRVALLSGHYRSDRPWSELLFADSALRVQRWQEALSSPYGGEVDSLIPEICTRLSEDLDTPGAFALLDRWASARRAHLPSEENQSVTEIGSLSRFLDAALGLTF